jgi:hypothetical protein
LPELRARVESGLQAILTEAIGPIGGLVSFIESTLDTYTLENPEKSTKLGWVPSATLPEAFLFAAEMDNICRSTLGPLEKLEVLQAAVCHACAAQSLLSGSQN